MIERLRRFCETIDLVSERLARVVAYLLALLMLLVTYEVVSRYVFNRPTSWSLEMNSFLYCIIVILGGAWVLSVNGHINVDIIYNRFSPRTKAIISLCTSLIIFTYLIFLIWTSWDTALTSLAWRETSGSSFNPPLYPLKFFIPVGASLFFLQSIARFTRFIIQAITGVESMKEYTAMRAHRTE